MIEQYWKLLVVVSILTGIGYFYLMVIKWKYLKNKKNVPLWIKVVLIPQVTVFLVLDWALNILLTVPMLDLPAKPLELTTGRLKRYKKDLTLIENIGIKLKPLDMYRLKFALLVCRELNRPGFHC